MSLLDRAPRHLFFTGKGGVGKTSVACATALALAARGRRVLLVSTDPASNQGAARAYRERLVGPYRGVLPDATVRSIEEQLSGACTVEIAAFDEFSKLLGDAATTGPFDHIVFDTAPTGHTLRLLELPAAWGAFLAAGAGGSCLGPLAGLKAQQALYDATRMALSDPDRTVLVLVSRPERSAIAEAARTVRERQGIGIRRYEFVLKGLFGASAQDDPVAQAPCARARAALSDMPPELASLPRTELPLVPYALIGIDALRTLLDNERLPRHPRLQTARLRMFPLSRRFSAIWEMVGAGSL